MTKQDQTSYITELARKASTLEPSLARLNPQESEFSSETDQKSVPPSYTILHRKKISTKECDERSPAPRVFLRAFSAAAPRTSSRLHLYPGTNKWHQKMGPKMDIAGTIYLGKLWYFTNLKSSLGDDFPNPIPTIPGFGRTVRSWWNLPWYNWYM